MKVTSITVDALPTSCHDCYFNRDKYCCLKMAMDNKKRYGSNFIHNNKNEIDKRCPLIDGFLGWNLRRREEEINA